MSQLPILLMLHSNMPFNANIRFILGYLYLFIRNISVSSTKNTILKKYDGRFKDIFAEIYAKVLDQF